MEYFMHILSIYRIKIPFSFTERLFCPFYKIAKNKEIHLFERNPSNYQTLWMKHLLDSLLQIGLW